MHLFIYVKDIFILHFIVILMPQSNSHSISRRHRLFTTLLKWKVVCLPKLHQVGSAFYTWSLMLLVHDRAPADGPHNGKAMQVFSLLFVVSEIKLQGKRSSCQWLETRCNAISNIWLLFTKYTSWTALLFLVLLLALAEQLHIFSSNFIGLNCPKSHKDCFYIHNSLVGLMKHKNVDQRRHLKQIKTFRLF